MSTQAQQSANVRNSQRSTGPVTAEGKQKAAQNSTKHFLTAKQLVAPGEDPENYTELHQGLNKSWNPANTQESLLVEQIAQNAWRLMRAQRMETALFIHIAPDPGSINREVPPPIDVVMLCAFQDNTKAFDNLRRYTAPIERAYHKAIDELTKLQKQTKIQEIGSVSQKAEPQQVYLAPMAARAVQNSNQTNQETAFTLHSDRIRRSSGT